MLAVVKNPHIKLSLSGEKRSVAEILEFLRSRYTVAILDERENGSEAGSVNAFETEFWRETAPGDLLQGYRLKHGLSQKQLAERSGICRTMISALEHGRRRLTPGAAARIGAALGENPEKFFLV